MRQAGHSPNFRINKYLRQRFIKSWFALRDLVFDLRAQCIPEIKDIAREADDDFSGNSVSLFLGWKYGFH